MGGRSPSSSRGRFARAALAALAAATALSLAGCGDPRPREWTEPVAGLRMVLVPAGSFTMGSPPEEPGREAQETQHEVRISRPFYLGRYEVTQAQWQAVDGTRPSWFSGCADCPVERVSFHDVERFLAELDRRAGRPYRLPTEAEWEYACRAGTATPFATGANLTTDQANYDGEGPYPGHPAGRFRRRTTRVGSFPPNAWGLHDMHGNVWEWTADWHCPYPAGPATDPLGRCSTEYRVIRGGSFFFDAASARCALRYTHRPQDSGFSLGFRVAVDAEAIARRQS
jgi:formylglycine-generating enzyme required for sulfatase activity